MTSEKQFTRTVGIFFSFKPLLQRRRQTLRGRCPSEPNIIEPVPHGTYEAVITTALIEAHKGA